MITRLNVGGPARQVLALKKEMTRRGVDETLATGYVDAGEADLAEMLGNDPSVRIANLVRPIRPIKDLRAYREIGRLIRELRPDVVHTHTSKAGVLGRVSALRREVPVSVHTFHGHVLDAYFKSHLERMIKLTESQLARRTSALLAVGEGVRQELAAYGVAPLERIQVVPAGIDLTPFSDIGAPGGPLRGRLAIPADAPVIGFAGRFVSVKRIDRLVESVRVVAEALPDVHIIVGGDGPNRSVLTEAAAQAPLAARIHLLGWVPDLRDFYEAVDVVVLTSDNEGTPISLIESGAAARPVVTTAVGGVADVVEDGTTGYVVGSSSTEIGEALKRVISDPEGARRMGAAGRQRVLTRYGASRLATDLIEIYERELSNRGG